MRGCAALAIVLMAVWSLSLTVAGVIVKADPRIAHSLAPADWIVAAKYAESAFIAAPTSDPDADLARLARSALLHEPAAVEALNLLTVQARIRGRPQEAQVLTRYGLALSRRELRLHLSRIEEAADVGDVATALRHYDLALRTSHEANVLLLRTLAAALVEPRIRESVAEMLASRPVWADRFIDTAAAGERNPLGAALFFQDRRNAGLDLSGAQRGRLIGSLLRTRSYDAAWDFYASFTPTARRDRSRDPTFTKDSIGENPLEWSDGDEPALASAIIPSAQGGSITLAAPAGIGGTAASQGQLLPPGRYRLSGRFEGLRLPENAHPLWVVTCTEGQVLVRVPVGDPIAGAGRFAGEFVVPGDCPSQTLALEIRPVDSTGGVNGTIVSTLIAPTP